MVKGDRTVKVDISTAEVHVKLLLKYSKSMAEVWYYHKDRIYYIKAVRELPTLVRDIEWWCWS